MATKTKLILAAIPILLITALAIYGWIQREKVIALEAEKIRQGYNQEKIRIEKEYIPAKLDELTTDELSTIGSNLWGE